MNLLSYSFNITPRRSMRERVERLEAIGAQLPQIECITRHHFAPGVYTREMVIPANAFATGAVHKTEHLTIIVGHCHLTTEESTKEFIGCNTIKSQPGTKRAIRTITETTLWTIHPTDETDPDKLCELLTESKADELIGGTNNRQLLAQKLKELGA